MWTPSVSSTPRAGPYGAGRLPNRSSVGAFRQLRSAPSPPASLTSAEKLEAEMSTTIILANGSKEQLPKQHEEFVINQTNNLYNNLKLIDENTALTLEVLTNNSSCSPKQKSEVIEKISQEVSDHLINNEESIQATLEAICRENSESPGQD